MRGAEVLDTFESGRDRGGIVWEGKHYRVLGENLCSVSSTGEITVIGSVGLDNNRRVTMDYSTDLLGIRSGTDLYYYNGSTVDQVTDADLGDVLDFVFIDGYFMTTDGEHLVVTDLNDPTRVDPIKYGSSEIDPDPLIGLMRIKGEVHACNRNTIEVFENVGGEGFPFSPIEGAILMKGIVGSQAKAYALDTFFFVGGGRGEELAVYAASSGKAERVSTDEIDMEINALTVEEQAEIEMEARKFDGMDVIYIHLPDKTWCYNATTSVAAEQPSWFCLTSSTGESGEYRLRNWTLAFGRWICGDTSDSQIMIETDSPNHGDDMVAWEFGTVGVYNGAKGAIVHDVELIGLPGSAPLEESPTIFHSWSSDGKTWSNEQATSAGVQGAYNTRMKWWRCGMFRVLRIFKFRGVTSTPMAFTAVEANLEALDA